jgi:hypothetical protein
MSKAQVDVLGAVVAILAFLSSDAIFIARMTGSPRIERVGGVLFLGLALPAIYLLLSASRLHRPPIYLGWVSLFMLFLVVELLLDYVFEVPFRDVRWQTILYVMLFFGSLGGMIGVAAQAGRLWAIAAVVSFLSTMGLAFLQHRATGL